MMLTNMYAELDLEAARRNNSQSNGRGNRRMGNGNGQNNNNDKKRGSRKIPQFTRNRKVSFEMCLFEKRKTDWYEFILGCDFQGGKV